MERRSYPHLPLRGTVTIYTIKPIAARLLKSGDTFRDGGQNFRIAGFEHDEDVVEITYYIGVGDLVNSFYLSPEDTLDLVIEIIETD